MTDPAARDRLAAQDPPNTYRPDVPFTSWMVLRAEASDGTPYYFHVPVTAEPIGRQPAEPAVNDVLAKVRAMTGTHECWDGDNFLSRQRHLLDRDDVLAAIDSWLGMSAARLSPPATPDPALRRLVEAASAVLDPPPADDAWWVSDTVAALRAALAALAEPTPGEAP